MWLLFSSIALQPQNCSSSHTHHAVPQPHHVYTCVWLASSACRLHSAEFRRIPPNSAEFCLLLHSAAIGRVWPRVVACGRVRLYARSAWYGGCGLRVSAGSLCLIMLRARGGSFEALLIMAPISFKIFLYGRVWPRVAACGRVWLLAHSVW